MARSNGEVILRTVFRMIWVALAFCFAAAVALVVLFALGAFWVGDELRRVAPHDPLFNEGAPLFGLVLFAGTVAPALSALPALLAVVVGEVLRIRSWIYYVPAGGVALAAIPLLVNAPGTDPTALPSSQVLAIFAAAGFAGGFVYWLLAGARA